MAVTYNSACDSEVYEPRPPERAVLTRLGGVGTQSVFRLHEPKAKVMTKPIATAAFAEKTGKSWQGWLDFLDGIGARDLSHTEIARAIVETGEASGWWAQGITVAYEQHIGRRQPGQRPNGGYEVSVSKTVSGSPEEAL